MHTKKFLAYGLVDPETNIVRYVGITTRSLKQRMVGHVSDINNRPNLNKHKTNWFLKLRKNNLIPQIILLKECSDLNELYQFEIDYITKYKVSNKLINQTNGGETIGFKTHTRESILKKSTTRPIVQYNILGEYIAEYEITEDAARELGLETASHITSCCRGKRTVAYNYVWRYKGDSFDKYSVEISPISLKCAKLIQYDLKYNKIAEYENTKQAAEAIGLKTGSNILSCIKGEQKTAGGFIFKAEPLYVYFDQSLFDETLKKYYNNNNRKQIKSGHGKTVEIFKNNESVGIFKSYSEASIYVMGTKNGRHHIKACCNNERDEYHGYKFKHCP